MGKIIDIKKTFCFILFVYGTREKISQSHGSGIGLFLSFIVKIFLKRFPYSRPALSVRFAEDCKMLIGLELIGWRTKGTIMKSLALTEMHPMKI